MEVILLERVPNLGQMGDVVQVKQGYARNFLLPQGRALRSTEENLVSFKSRKLDLEAKNLELRKEAQSVAEKLDAIEIVVIRSASDTRALYGSVTKRDIEDAATADGTGISRLQIELSRPIKELGLHPVVVTLHPEVQVSISVNVARSENEARLQSAGKSIPGLDDADDVADEQEVAELFDEISEESIDAQAQSDLDTNEMSA